MISLQLALFNATGLPRQSVTPLLDFNQQSSILLITETWLLPPLGYPVNWKQYHTYGTKRLAHSYHGQQGISLLVHPDCPFNIHHITSDTSDLAQYKLSFTVSNVLVHCLYIPPRTQIDKVRQILDSLSFAEAGTTQTIICGDFNARMGDATGDKATNTIGTFVSDWIRQNQLINWNSRLCFGIST
ncbi:Endonuclease/exonuclease/phosphatase, partial [Blakeslea trispora]